MDIGLKNRIENYVKAWYEFDPSRAIHKGDILRKAMEIGYESETAGRRCRDLVDEGKLEPVYNEKGHVMYRYKPSYVN